ncbi:MAG: 4Fe-4S double cluster binding domain-containing protein [Chloroflexota bacterium]
MNNFDQTRNAGIISASGETYEYQYRTVSVSHFPELQEEIESLRRKGQLCSSEIFQGYMGLMDYALPEDFQDAQSVIIMAIAIRPMEINFQFNGNRFSAFMPPNYYDAGLTGEILEDEVQKKIIQQAGCRVLRTRNRFHLKLLAARSGLGRYGRNNICYVDGMGSLLTLHTFLTDYRFEADDWHEIQMMELCQNCKICMKACPGGAIRSDNFVIDVNRCIPLYNEIEGVLPDWIPADAHNAFMGCMKCQLPCPANREPLKRAGQFEEITEEETRQFLSGEPEENVILSVSRKIRMPRLALSKEMVEVASRNIGALLPRYEGAKENMEW